MDFFCCLGALRTSLYSKTHFMKKIVLIVFISFSIASSEQGFLHRNGQEIVDGNENNIVLRGLGLGGWMVQEGYMLQTGSFAGPQHIIKQKRSNLSSTKKNYLFTMPNYNGLLSLEILI